jgi:hypothetical protein
MGKFGLKDKQILKIFLKKYGEGGTKIATQLRFDFGNTK